MKARTRTVKPEFFQDKGLAKVKPITRLLYIGLWQIADKEGKLEDNPDLIKGFIFPYHKISVDSMLKELENGTFIIRYEVQNNAYIWIPAFKKHQNTHPNEAHSVIPLPEDVIKRYDNVIKCNVKVGGCNGTSSSSFSSTSNSNILSGKPDDTSLAEKIIQDLNLVCNKKFKLATGKTESHINARLAEGYTLDDFKKVHRVKFEEWSGTDLAYCIRPKTFYTPENFESYINQANTEGVEAERKKTPAELEVEKLNLDLKKQGIV